MTKTNSIRLLFLLRLFILTIIILDGLLFSQGRYDYAIFLLLISLPTIFISISTAVIHGKEVLISNSSFFGLLKREISLTKNNVVEFTLIDDSTDIEDNSWTSDNFIVNTLSLFFSPRTLKNLKTKISYISTDGHEKQITVKLTSDEFEKSRTILIGQSTSH